jgi:diacylglycerol O-acyltransferase
MGRLSGLDAAFLGLETRVRPMHLGAVAVFRGPVSPTRLRTLLAERAARLPALRVAGSWFPAWWPASDFDPATHVHAFEVRGQRAFEAYVAGWLATPLDLSRPPWAVHVVTGLPDDRFAVLVKLHHSLADGAGAVALAGALLDGGGLPPTRSTAPRAHGLGETAAMAGAVARAVRKPPVPAMLASGGTARRVAFVRLDLADVRQIRRQHGGTTNDVALAVLAGGLREWLKSRDVAVDGATPRALIPVNTRARGGAGGNQLSGYLCDLPVGLADPVARLHAVRKAMDANKAMGPSKGGGTLAILANQLPPALHRFTGAVGIAAPLLFDTVVTTVPLPSVPLSFDGAPLDEIYPFGPLGPGHALGIAISPYRDAVHIGLQTDRDAVPDIDVLASAISKACSTLHERAD